MGTLKGENALADDGMEARAQEQVERADQKLEEGRARWEAEASKADDEGEKMLRYLPTTPYQTKDRDTPEEPRL
jgi:hypothetical protein